MNELIKITEQTIGEGAVQSVNARDLHAFLKVGKDFSNWIKDRIQQYGFVAGQDYVIAGIGEQLPSGTKYRKEYFATLDMAKELAMVERNERGKQARQYFLECERRAKSQPSAHFNVPQTMSAALRLAADQAETIERQTTLISVMQPKAEFHDAVTEAINAQSINQVAKVFRTGQNRFFKWLRSEGILMANNVPYQPHVDAGHFRVVERQYRDRLGEVVTYTRTLVTGKGLTYLQRRWNRQSNEVTVANG